MKLGEHCGEVLQALEYLFFKSALLRTVYQTSVLDTGFAMIAGLVWPIQVEGGIGCHS